jgi:hypothetical protein
MSLMRKAHEGVPTQFGLGVSQAALIVGERAGYGLRSSVPVYLRVLRTRYWLRKGNPTLLQGGLRLAAETSRRILHRHSRPHMTLTLQRVSCFGSEIDPILSQAKLNAIITRRNAPRLNTMLRFPRQAMSGWHLLDDTAKLRGFALLNLVPENQGWLCTGKIVDCLLDSVDVSLWQAAMDSLAEELARQGADAALAYASTAWAESALQRSGFTARFAVKFHIRDRQHLIPPDAVFHLTPLEGDYAYT